MLGRTIYRYIQTYKSIPIYATTWIIRGDDEGILSMNGVIFSDIETDENITLKKNSARNIALSDVGAETYKWEISRGRRAFKKNKQEILMPLITLNGQMVLIAEDQNFKSNKLRPAYEFEIYAHQPLSKKNYYVDAITGSILFVENLIQHVDVQGTAETKFSGTQTITTDSTGPASYRLRETGRGNGIETYNMLEGTSYGNAVDFYRFR